MASTADAQHREVKSNKYQLSPIDPRDGIVLLTELDNHCDKLQRSSVGARRYQLLLTDDGPVYHALSVHLSRAKLVAHFDDRYAVAKFSRSPELRKSSIG